MNNVINLFAHQWILGAVAIIIVIFIVFSIIRTAVKLAIVIAVIGIILVVFFGVSESDLMKTGKAALNDATTLYQKNVEPILNKEIDQAKFSTKPNGEFVIKGDHFKIYGKKGENKLKIEYQNKTYTIDSTQLSEQIQQRIKEYEKQTPSQTNQ